MDLNKAMIIGRLTRDPDIRTTPSGQTVANFSVATNRTWTDQAGQKQEKVEFHNVVAWRKLAEIIQQYVHKGDKIYIEGRLETRDWQTQDGQKRSTTEITADNMIMLNTRGAGGSGQAGQVAAGGPANAPSAAQPQGPPPPVAEGEEEIKVENIPF